MQLTRRAFVALVSALPFAKGLPGDPPASAAHPPRQNYPIPVTCYEGAQVVDTKRIMHGGRDIIVPCLTLAGYVDCVFTPTGYDGDGESGITRIHAQYVSGPRYWIQPTTPRPA